MICKRKNYANVSVLISTYNRPEALDCVLEGYSQQTKLPAQIIVADDGSDERTLQIVTKWSSCGLPIEHCWHDDRGFRKTVIMNKALKKVRTPTCVFTDGDCIPLKRFVEQHEMAQEKGYMLAGSRVLANSHFTKQIEEKLVSPLSMNSLFWLKRFFTREINRLPLDFNNLNGWWRRVSPFDWKLVRGCNFSVSTKSLFEVRGFDESLIGWGFEDSDLAVRLINHGVRVKSLRFAATVLHLWHAEYDRSNSLKNNAALNEAIINKRTLPRDTSLAENDIDKSI